jgi:hypothetical protein
MLAMALGCCMTLHAQDMESREAAVARIVEATALDRLILANARAKLAGDPKVEKRVDDFLYNLRKPALWNSAHPSWAPVRAALMEEVARESNEWLRGYWPQASKIHVMDLAGGYRLQDILVMQEFALSEGGKAYYGKRLAEARVKAGEAMFSLDPASTPTLQKLAGEAKKRFDALPAAEKKRVEEFIAPLPCGECGHAYAIERWIAGQSKWIAEVLVNHLSDVDYKKREAWNAALNAKFASVLPVDSKKQLLGTLELRPDATLVFRFTFPQGDSATGGNLALEIPRSAPQYAETLALAPGLASGKGRVLYRGEDGIVSDKP